MRLAFMGTPDFAVPALRALHGAGHEIAAVYCQPARPAGRGQRVRPSPVEAAAAALGLPVRTPAKLRRSAEEHAAFAALRLDAAVVAAYGLILPAEMLSAPRLGCLNIHASLLPRWRGAAPIQAAILAGDAETGITVMKMDEGLDTGAMLLRESVAIGDDTTAASLHDALAEIGGRLILRALAESPSPTPQPAEGATYAAKLSREDGRLDWSRSSAELDRHVRALNPWPGVFTTLDGEMLKVLAVRREETSPEAGSGEKREGAPPGEKREGAPPGATLDDALLVATGEGGALRIVRLQAAGRAAMDAAAFLRGRPVAAGARLGTATAG